MSRLISFPCGRLLKGGNEVGTYKLSGQRPSFSKGVNLVFARRVGEVALTAKASKVISSERRWTDLYACKSGLKVAGTGIVSYIAIPSIAMRFVDVIIIYF